MWAFSLKEDEILRDQEDKNWGVFKIYSILSNFPNVDNCNNFLIDFFL